MDYERMGKEMAVTFILAKKMRVDRLINYVANPVKTAELKYVSSINCEVKTAAHEWLSTKERYGKSDGVQAYHIIQSFKIGELSPELAHEIGREFSAEFLDGYEVVIGTHVDKSHVHNHIDNEDQLDAREMEINSEIERLTKSRIIWNSKKKRRKKLYDALADSKYYADTALLYADGVTGIEDEYRKYVQAEELLEGIDREDLLREQTEVYDHIAEVNRELRSLRSELTIVKNLRRDIPHIANELNVGLARNNAKEPRERNNTEQQR